MRVSTVLELVIFDCDGVLVDSEELANQVLCQALNKLGVAISEQRSIALFRGRSLASCGKIIEQEFNVSVPESFWDQLQRLTFARFAEELTPIEGVEKLLAELQYPSCVASSGDFIKLAFSLTSTGLERFFSRRIYSAQQVKRGKPAPDLFLYAAARCGVSPAKACVIEDSRAGVEAALAAKMPVFWYRGPKQVPTGCTVFESMAQLPALLAELDRQLMQ